MTLQRTKSKFKLTGIVSGISSDGAYRSGTTESGKEYQALSFLVETSPNNKVKVELFGMVRDTVIAFSNKAKKEKKESVKKVKWENRHNNFGDFKVLGVKSSLESSAGKLVDKQLVEYDAIEYIMNHLEDGESVNVGGSIDIQNYTTDSGRKGEKATFKIGYISKAKDAVDFSAEDFKEVCSFNQEIVVFDTELDEEASRLHVLGKTIQYDSKTEDNGFLDYTFSVDTEKQPKLATNIKKRLALGDMIEVFGKIVSTIEITEGTDTDDEDGADVEEEVEDWGNDEEAVSDFNNRYITNFINELLITAVDASTLKKGKYTEEQMFSEAEEAFEEGYDDSDEFDDEDDEDNPFK